MANRNREKRLYKAAVRGGGGGRGEGGGDGDGGGGGGGLRWLIKKERKDYWVGRQM